jgi:hypothetical protein
MVDGRERLVACDGLWRRAIQPGTSVTKVARAAFNSSFQFVSHRLVRVRSIDMEEIDTAILDHHASVVEGHLQTCRETAETRIMVCLQVFKHTLLRIYVNIAVPRVHGERLRVELQRSDRLTERAI